MDMFVIQGGKRLRGDVTVSGSKNASLPILAASLLATEPCKLTNVPDLADVRSMTTLLGSLGVGVQQPGPHPLELTPGPTSSILAHYELVRKMRASFCVLGPLLAKHGKACVSLPGGCNIGHRPINLHLKGLAALGAEIRIERGYVIAKAQKLVGRSVFLGGPFGSTVTGTCNVMSAATLAHGETVIESAACEPEVVELGRCLIQMGARIDGLGTPTIRIQGVEELGGLDHAVEPDRIEAATLLMVAAVAGDDVTIRRVPVEQMTSVLEILDQVGVSMSIIREGGHADVRVEKGEFGLRPSQIVALPYPGIPTDVQAQFTAMLTQANGISVVTDKVFPDRFMHLAELERLGAEIRREHNSAIVSGPCTLSGANVMASDLRASAALVIAALCAQGESTIRRVYHLDRGYERFDEKLRALGARVERVKDLPENQPENLIPDVASEGWLQGPHVGVGERITAGRE